MRFLGVYFFKARRADMIIDMDELKQPPTPMG